MCILSLLNVYQRWMLVLTLVFLSVLLSACDSQQPSPVPTAAQEIVSTPQPTSTASPTLTPTPAQPTVILLAAPDADASLVDGLQARLEEFSAQQGWQFELKEQLSPSDLGDNIRLVVALAPDPGLVELAAAAPQAQFLAVGIPGIQPTDNLSSVSAGGIRPDQLAFTAGYMAAAITEDWRVGIISEADTAAGRAAELAFTNGVFFLCGLCRPVNPPFPIPGYPLVAQLSAGADQAERQSAIDLFKLWQVGTVYVAPEVVDPELLRELADAGLRMIGTQSPPADVKSSWVATLGSGDLLSAVDELLPVLLGGQGSQDNQLPLTISDINADLLSPGRQRLVEEMLVDLMAGYIDTGAGLETGEGNN